MQLFHLACWYAMLQQVVSWQLKRNTQMWQIYENITERSASQVLWSLLLHSLIILWDHCDTNALKVMMVILSYFLFYMSSCLIDILDSLKYKHTKVFHVEMKLWWIDIWVYQHIFNVSLRFIVKCSTHLCCVSNNGVFIDMNYKKSSYRILSRVSFKKIFKKTSSDLNWKLPGDEIR